MNIAAIAASFFGAMLSAMGMGGGGLLLLYLVMFAGLEQLEAQGVNLIFFIPVALVSIIIHAKNRLIIWRYVWISVPVGLAGAWFGVKLAQKTENELLKKLFGGLLLLIGIKEFISFFKDSKKKA